MLGVYTILGVAEEGWGSSQTSVLGAASIVLLAAFVLRQTRVANPLMPLRLFRSRNVSGANLVQALIVVGMFGDVLPRAPSTCSGSSATTRSRSGSPTCR